MNAKDRAAWESFKRRVDSRRGVLRTMILQALDNIEKTLTPAQISQYISSGSLERVFGQAGLDQFFQGVAQHLHKEVVSASEFFTKDLPNKGVLGNGARVGFDLLNPDVITAIRQLDTRVFEPLSKQVGETARKIVEEGLRAGQNPTQIARGLRDVIGLAPHQVDAVNNYRRELEAGSKGALDRKLRDRRFDRLVGRASPEQIDRMVKAYKDRFTAWNAEVNARTMTLDATKLGQRITWENAIKQGLVQKKDLWKRWVGVKDERERASHLAMEGEEVPFDQPFSNGQMVPGDSEFNCRCIAVYFLKYDTKRATSAEEAKGAENARLEALGLPADHPLRKKARRDERNRLKREAALAGKAPPAPAPVPAPIRTDIPISRSTAVALRGDLDPQVKTELDKAEKFLLPLEHERAAVFDENGKMVLAKVGVRDAVEFTPAETRKMRDRILTHNHPAQTWALSDADIDIAMDADMREMRAVTRKGFVSLQRPAEGWTRAKTLFASEKKRVTRELADVATARSKEIFALEDKHGPFHHLVQQKRREADALRADYYHDLWSRVFNNLGVVYERKEW